MDAIFSPQKKGLRITLLFVLFALRAQAQVSSNFTTDNEGWKVINNNTGLNAAATWNGSGGNPGGYISYTTLAVDVPYYFQAPGKFNGNFGRSYNQTLKFDLYVNTAGTDGSYGDVILSGTGYTFTFPLPVKPASGTWTSYTITLNESAGWYNGCPTCPPTQNQFKQAIENITNLQIRLKYLSGNSSPYTGQLDNVVINTMPLGTPPVITSFSPISALAGSTVTIAGSNFDAIATQNIVYFNGMKGTVTGASATQLIVTVPKSAADGPITAINLTSGLQATSGQNFNLLFDNNKDFGGRIIPSTMLQGTKALLPMADLYNNDGGMDKGDFDGDGWIDLVTTEDGISHTPAIYVFRNLGTGGTVSSSSFSAAITLPDFSGIPGGSPNLGLLSVADVDSDGMLDVVAVTSSGGGAGYLAVFRNTSTSGNISFNSPQFFGYPYYSSQLRMTLGDYDGDGRVDFAYTTGTSPGGLWINQNLSSPGNINFAYGFLAGTTLAHTGLTTGDLNADGKPEIIAGLGGAFEIYQNTSTGGAITFNAPFSLTTPNASIVRVADLDADNKPDLLWSTNGAFYIYFAQNIYSGSTFNASSFGATFQVANSLSFTATNGISVGDMNADGKPDVVISGNSDLGVLQNVGATGSLSANSFFPLVPFQGTSAGHSTPIIADLDGDNKPEVAFVHTGNVTSQNGINIFHNESFPAPSIVSVTPSPANVSASITVNGNLMMTGNSTPSVRMNKINSSVTASSNTSVTTTNPLGAIGGKLILTNHALAAVSPYVNSTFNTARVINSSSFGPSVDFAMGFSPKDILEVADFDDDGKMDVVTGESSGGDVFLNANSVGQSISSSSLSKIAAPYNVYYNVLALDIDGDGKVDLDVGGALLQNTSSTGAISFASGPGGIATSAPAFGYGAYSDFNKDGKLDLALTTGNVAVVENLSTKGPFVYGTNFPTLANPTYLPTANNYVGIVATDFDGDGYDDVVVTSTAGNLFTSYLNLAVNGPITASSFSTGTNVTTASSPRGITASDFDGDGKTDIAISYFSSTINYVSVCINKSTIGTISFAPPVNLTSASWAYNLVSQDLDGDGLAEIVVIHQPNPGTPSFTVLKNNSTPGNINFAAGINTTLSRSPQALNIADINSDQKPDILIVANSSTIGNALMVFQNNIVVPVIAVNTQPTNAAVCDGNTGQFTVAASGTTNITYQWQYSSDGIAPYADITNIGGYTNVATSTLSVNTTGNFGAGFYRCRVNGDFANQVTTNASTLTVNAVPAVPVTSNVSHCGSGSVMFTASGGSNGNYIWYDPSSAVISGQTNPTYTTPVLAATAIST
jgi:hypothetical protein